MTPRSCRFACLCALVVLLGHSALAHAKRVALVIGNDNYQMVSRLEKAGNDADAMARELTAAGFEVRKHRDLNFKQMVVAFEAFFDQVKGGDEVAVFYAGHGVQTERGSYLLPTDVEGDTQSQIEKVSYSVNGLLEELDKVKPRFSLIIVDACRDNPLRSRGRTIGVARGLNAPDLAKGQMVVFSAGKNQKALDSLNDRDTNPNGVFTREFVARMRQPGLNVETLATDVRNSVERLARSANHDQRPLIVNDSSGEFYFFEPAAGSGPARAQAALTAGEATREDQFWQDAKGPDNIEGYQAYLSTYPNGRYAGLAGANISRLRTLSGGAPAPTPARPPVVVAASTPASPAPRPAAGPADNRRVLASYTLANGDKYEGETVGVVRTGKGTYSFANGDRYVGDLQDNVFTGKGVMTFAYGDRYEGDYVRGQKHGRGVYVFANRDRFEGAFADNLYQGQGSLTYSNGDRFEGNYERGIKQGAGVYRFANGDRYEGNFLNNVFSGQGKLFLANGDRYEGSFANNVKEGVGVHHFANRDRYEGTFRAGAQAGTGTLYFANGDKYAGLFEAGVRHGKGLHTFANGQVKPLEYVHGAEKTN